MFFIIFVLKPVFQLVIDGFSCFCAFFCVFLPVLGVFDVFGVCFTGSGCGPFWRVFFYCKSGPSGIFTMNIRFRGVRQMRRFRQKSDFLRFNTEATLRFSCFFGLKRLLEVKMFIVEQFALVETLFARRFGNRVFLSFFGFWSQ